MLPTLRQLEYAVAVAERKSFTLAAKTCFATQSTLSAGLGELEDVLGVRLFERDRAGVVITPVGAEIVARASAVLAASRDLVDVAAAAAGPMKGTLRFGAIPTIAPFLLPTLLPEVRAAHPALKLALREDLTPNLLARLRAGQLDLALVALPFDTGELVVEPLFDDELWLVGRRDDEAMRAKRVVVSAPIEGRLLLLEEGHCLREHTLATCSAGVRAASAEAAGVEATSLLTLLEMVAFGLGLALLPGMAVASGLVDDHDLVARPLAASAPKRTIALVARPTTARRAELAALARMIAKPVVRAPPAASKPRRAARR